MNDNTIKFVVPEDSSEEMKTILTAVYGALSEKGYNPINQIVGYLLSEDPGYPPSLFLIVLLTAGPCRT